MFKKSLDLFLKMAKKITNKKVIFILFLIYFRIQVKSHLVNQTIFLCQKLKNQKLQKLHQRKK